MKTALKPRASSEHAGSNTADLLAKVADEYMQAVERGERPDIEAFAERYPNIAAILRDVLPALTLMSSAASHGGLTATSAENLSERTLGDFRIGREIGRGGMGVVYEAEQISLGRKVALKVLPFAGVLDERQLQRFKNEARAAATLEHPHIVPVYSVGCERGVHYFAMRYIDGQSLAQILQAFPAYQAEAGISGSALAAQLSDGLARHSGQPDSSSGDGKPTPSAPPDTRREMQAAISTDADFGGPAYLQSIARLGIQAAEALAYAHEQGLLHRDIKPGNLLLDVNGELWVADFGLARLEQDAGLTVSGDMLGTLRYMSPEQAQGHRVLDERSDVYSLGITLYEMLVLRPAFSGHDRAEILRRITSEEPQPPRQINPRIPRDLETIVLKAICKEPASRYASAQQLADDLRRYLQDQPIQARRPTLIERCVKWSRRHPGAVAAALLVLFVATVASVTSALLINNAYTNEATARKLADDRLNQINAATHLDLVKADLHLIDVLAQLPQNSDEVLAGSAIQGDPLTVRILLDRVAKNRTPDQVRAIFSDELMRVQASVQDSVGTLYLEIKEYERAITFLEPALNTWVEALKEEDESMDGCVANLLYAYLATGRFAKALEHGHKYYEDPELSSKMWFDVLDFQEAGQWEVALRVYDEIHKLIFEENPSAAGGTPHRVVKSYLDLVRSLPDGSQLLPTLRSLAQKYLAVKKPELAALLLEEVLRLQREQPTADDPQTIADMRSLAQSYFDFKKPELAAPAVMELWQIGVMGDFDQDDPRAFDSIARAAKAQRDAGKYEAAAAMWEKILPIEWKRLGENDPSAAATMHADSLATSNNLIDVYRLLGRFDEAVDLGRKTLNARNAIPEATRKSDPERYRGDRRLTMQHLVLALVARGNLNGDGPLVREDIDAAEALLRTMVIDELDQFSNKQDQLIDWGNAQLAWILLREERFADAEPYARKAWELRQSEVRQDWRWRLFSAESLVGGALLGQRQYPEAELRLLSAYKGLTDLANKPPADSRIYLKQTLQRLVQHYEATDRPDEAAKWKAKLSEQDGK